MMPDDLKRALDKWQAPQPGAALDDRVRASWLQARTKPKPWKLCGAIAAGLLIAAAQFWPAGPKPATGDPTRLETRLRASGFRPIPDGAVTVVKARSKR